MSEATPAGIDRREALGLLSAVGLAAMSVAAAQGQAPAPQGQPAPAPTGPAAAAPPGAPITPQMMGWNQAKGQYELPALPYPYNALEPHIDSDTMQIHHTRHHAAYVAGMNRALVELENIRMGRAESTLIKHWSRELSFNAGGHMNHCLFWLCMAPPGKGGGGQPTGPLMEQINADFSTFDIFRTQFMEAALLVEGSGWAWLMYDRFARRTFVHQMEKQQDLLVNGATPLLGIDVWEHAYYLRYRNVRKDYISHFMNVINWGRVQTMFEKSSAG